MFTQQQERAICLWHNNFYFKHLVLKIFQKPTWYAYRRATNNYTALNFHTAWSTLLKHNSLHEDLPWSLSQMIEHMWLLEEARLDKHFIEFPILPISWMAWPCSIPGCFHCARPRNSLAQLVFRKAQLDMFNLNSKKILEANTSQA